MAKMTRTADKKASSKPKSSKKTRQADAAGAPAIEVALRINEDRIRERAYCIWLAEGQPYGRDLAHWQRARRELLATP